MQDGNSIKLTKIIVCVSPTYIQHAILHTDSETSQLADLCIGAMKKNNTLYNFFSKHEKIFQVWKKKKISPKQETEKNDSWRENWVFQIRGVLEVFGPLISLR